MNRDVVCQLPPEAGHPPIFAARLRKHAYGMNDAPRRWWNILDKARCSYGMVPMRADRCCYVLYSMHSRERTWNQGDTIHSGRTQTASQSNRVCGQKQMMHMVECWIPLQAAQPQDDPWLELLFFLLMISLELVELKWNNVCWLDSEKISK